MKDINGWLILLVEAVIASGDKELMLTTSDYLHSLEQSGFNLSDAVDQMWEKLTIKTL